MIRLSALLVPVAALALLVTAACGGDTSAPAEPKPTDDGALSSDDGPV